jgi:predicted nucleotidyltransferase
VNPQREAAWELQQFLSELGVPYAIIGGLAVQFWGQPRLTDDVDLTISVPIEDAEGVVRLLVERFVSRCSDPVGFARRTRVVLIHASNGCPVDISLALPGYEDEVMCRAVNYEIEPGKVVRLCSAEDLIIHKAVAGRPQDVADIEGVIYRQEDALDVSYIRLWLRELAALLEDPERIELFEKPWRTLHSK